MPLPGLTAPLVVDGTVNGAVVRCWIEQQLAPTLRPGDIDFMDNLAAHKVAGDRGGGCGPGLGAGFGG